MLKKNFTGIMTLLLAAIMCMSLTAAAFATESVPTEDITVMEETSAVTEGTITAEEPAIAEEPLETTAEDPEEDPEEETAEAPVKDDEEETTESPEKDGEEETTEVPVAEPETEEIPEETTEPETEEAAKEDAELEVAAAASGKCGPNATWSLEDGVLTVSGTGPMYDYDVSGSSNVPGWADIRSEIKEVYLENEITTVGDYAFYGCSNMTYLWLSNNLETIGKYAFAYCTSYNSYLMIPEPVTTIKKGAFYGCTSIGLVEMPDEMVSIEDAAFAACTSLQSLNFPEGITTITTACQGCTNLYAMGIPSTVKQINAGATAGLDSFQFIGYYGTEADWRNISIGMNNDVLYNVTVSCILDGQQIPALMKTFQDVSDPTKYYYDAVYWAYNKGITTGTSMTNFSPDLPCTRGQVVTFLWRLMGSPKPSVSGIFEDVPDGQYYTDAVYWAFENDITTGTSKTKFSPNLPCTRGQVVTFLWRLAGEEQTASTGVFQDVEEEKYYCTPVYWAAANNITTGISATRFSPDGTCTRGQIVTFLYRYAN